MMVQTLTVRRHSLSPEQIQTLRERHPFAADQAWIPEFVRVQGWLTANIRYLEGERQRSATAMRDMMRELGVEQIQSAAEAVDLIELAVGVFAPEPGFAGTVAREADCSLRITNPHCPVYQSFQDAKWMGVTACASWHRRRGWIDALGVVATDFVCGEKKWGDPACECVIEVRRVATAG